MDCMNWLQRLIARALPLPEYREGTILAPPRPPSRRAGATLSDAVTLPAVYRALDIIATAAAQLPLRVEKDGEDIARPPAIARRPSLHMTRSEWIASIVLDMATNGDATVIVDRDTAGHAIALEPVPSAHVHIEQHDDGTQTGHYRGRRYRVGTDMLLLARMRLPGRLRGLGPIQAAMSTVAGALDVRDYVAQWWQGSGQPAGVLTTEQFLTPDDAREYIRAWNRLGADGKPDPTLLAENPAGIKVLGKGLHYSPILLNPADAMWLEAQEWTTLDVARVFGTPSSLMLVAPSGGTDTYANVEQDWIAFTRFTLAGYLRPLEEAISGVLARGQEARFNYDALLRSDRKTRYEGHEIGLRAGFLTIDEVRRIESLPTGGPPQ